MSEQDFDRALIAAAFRRAASDGWAGVSVYDAAREAGLPAAEARARFSGKRALLLRFGALLDQDALAAVSQEGTVRDRLFDLLMERFMAMRAHRAGIVALVRYLPSDPCTALAMARATRASMRWMLHAAGISTSGLRGAARVGGLAAVWSWTARTFESDESDDLTATMAALDRALGRADRLARWFSGERGPESPDDGDASAAEIES